MERVGTHKYLYVLIYIKEPTELVFSRVTLTLLHFFLRHLSDPFKQSAMAGCSVPLTLVVVQNPLSQVRVNRDSSTVNQNPLSRQIPGAVTMTSNQQCCKGS